MGTAADDATNTKIMESVTDIARPYSFAAAMSWIYAFCLLLLMAAAFLLLRERRDGRGDGCEENESPGARRQGVGEAGPRPAGSSGPWPGWRPISYSQGWDSCSYIP